MVQFASYLRRVLHKARLIFSRINGPIVSISSDYGTLEQIISPEDDSFLDPNKDLSPLSKLSKLFSLLFKVIFDAESVPFEESLDCRTRTTRERLDYEYEIFS